MQAASTPDTEPADSDPGVWHSDDTDSRDDTDDTDLPEPPGLDRFVDCAAGDGTGDGQTATTAWRTLGRLAVEPLAPGATVRIARGSVCAGPLTVSGSGSATAPIRVQAHGDGVDPIIDGTGLPAAVSLRDQSWITLSGLRITGSTRWGVYVGSAAGAVKGITLEDLEVHDVWGGAPDNKATGLVVFTVEGEDAWFEDIDVHDVTAWNTDRWSGIFLYGVSWRTDGPRSARVTFRDNVVHDVAGDGIVAFGTDDALLDGNLAYEVGGVPTDAIGTPNGIWTWDCRQCVVQWNEAHHVHSPTVDGGAFDIDWDTVDNVVQYNAGHDNDGYCVAVFAAEGSVTSGAVVRHNLCWNNGVAQARAYQGDLFLYTWNGGTLGDVQIYGNTVVRNSVHGYPPLIGWSEVGEGSGIWNNVFVVDGDWMATVAGDVALGDNLWWQSSTQGHAWYDDHAGGWSDGLSAWSAASGELGSLWQDPALTGGSGRAALRLKAGSPAIDAGRVVPGAGACDAFGGGVTGPPDIGAHEFGAVAAPECG